MKKLLVVTAAAAIAIGASAFGAFKWQEHSKKVAKCQSYLDRMTLIFESDVERTMSRFRLLKNKYDNGTLTQSDAELLPLITNKVVVDVLPALTDIKNPARDMMEKCKIEKMNKKGKLLAEKYKLLADPEGVQISRVEELEELEESGGNLKDLNNNNALPEITNNSNEFATSLSKHLKKVGAVMYSSYWSPHCHEQLQLFGKSAVNNLEIIECAYNGKDSQVDRCMKEAIENYPTWSMPGNMSPGVKSLKELAAWSGYKD